MKLGIIREGKVPPDSRVLFTPKQCVNLQQKYNVQFIVQHSPGRCLNDDLYRNAGITISEDVSDCDVLMGIKEVPKDQLVPGKKYFFFSHTIKEQPYNSDLLKKIISYIGCSGWTCLTSIVTSDCFREVGIDMPCLNLAIFVGEFSGSAKYASTSLESGGPETNTSGSMLAEPTSLQSYILFGLLLPGS